MDVTKITKQLFEFQTPEQYSSPFFSSVKYFSLVNSFCNVKILEIFNEISFWLFHGAYVAKKFINKEARIKHFSLGERDCQQCDQGHGELPGGSVPGHWGRHWNVHFGDSCHEEEGDHCGCKSQQSGQHQTVPGD